MYRKTNFGLVSITVVLVQDPHEDQAVTYVQGDLGLAHVCLYVGGSVLESPEDPG